MPNRVVVLLFVSTLAGFAQSEPPTTELTYFLGRSVAFATPRAVAAGPGGDIWVGGETFGNSLPVVNAFQAEYSPGFCGRLGACSDLFLSRLRADGQGAVFSTYLGGMGAESLGDLAVDGEGNAYLVGGTGSEAFPFASPIPGDTDIASRPFAVKVSPAGEIVQATALPSGLFPRAIAPTGVGAFSPALADGEVAPVEPPFPTAPGIASIDFSIRQTQVTYAGAAP